MALLERYLEVKKSTIPEAGMGLFTKTLIPKGTRIVEYKGRVTTWKGANHLDGANPYIFYVKDNHVIDTLRCKKSLARYANDAKGLTKIKGISNNCRFVVEGLRVFIEAEKNIPAGSELLVGYGKGYWNTVLANRKLDNLQKR
jgi:SET domain-containing protein